MSCNFTVLFIGMLKILIITIIAACMVSHVESGLHNCPDWWMNWKYLIRICEGYRQFEIKNLWHGKFALQVKCNSDYSHFKTYWLRDMECRDLRLTGTREEIRQKIESKLRTLGSAAPGLHSFLKIYFWTLQ